MEKRSLDRGTVAGVVLAVVGISLGLVLDGGSLRQILQPTAALIVLGGTVGAVLIQFPFPTVLSTLRQLRHALLEPALLTEDTINTLVLYCMRARRSGLVKLEAEIAAMQDPFLRKALTFAVDGLSARDLREVMEVDLCLQEEKEEREVRVLEAAGGFAPTLGIVGAVLGLIQVMQRMDNVAEIGKGIAVAFVSTLYGIGAANLCFLPLAGRLRIRMREHLLLREMTLDAVVLMVEGIGATALRHRLESYRPEAPAAVAADGTELVIQ